MIEDHQTEYIGLFSGGKDSLAVCHYLWKQGVLKEVIYCHTGVGLNEDYVKEMCKKFDWKLTIVYPRDGHSYEDFVKKFGFPHAGMHHVIMSWIKFKPIMKWHREQKAEGRMITFISGRRKKESARRMKMKSNQEYAISDGMQFWSAIFDWETVDVWDYLKKHDLNRSPIYDTMHLSGDCMCGAYSSKGESDWLKIFHPEMAQRFMDLEKKYNDKWGNQISLTDMENQTKLNDDLICQECQV